MQKKAFFDCPSCGRRCEYTIWESIDADKEPEAKEALIAGDLFVHECPDCGNRINIVYSVLYQDSSNNVMVNLVSDCSDINAEIEKFKAIKDYVLVTGPMGEPQVRFVNNPNDLREKATIFDAGLDDRVIELMKLEYLSKPEEDDHKKAIRTYFVRDKDGRYKFEFVYVEGNVYIDFDKTLYDRIFDELKKTPDVLNEEVYSVDSAWAKMQNKE